MCNAIGQVAERAPGLTRSFLAIAAVSLLVWLMKFALRLLSIGLIAALAGSFLGTPADAQPKQRAPSDLWCRDVQIGWGGGSVMICRAYSYEQCMASRTSHIETCYLNPLYDPRFAEWRKRNPHY